MNYAISLLKHLSARLIINGWLPVEDRQMRWTSHQIGFFSISLIQLGCLPFCMQIVFDYGALYNLLGFFLVCFVLLNCSQFSRRVLCGVFWHHKMAVRDLKSHPVLHRLLLSPFLCVCLLISNRQIQIWPKQTVRLGTVLGACRVSESTQMPPCLEELSVKMLPPNQSLMDLTRHGFRCENKHGKKYTTQDNSDLVLAQVG